MNKQFDLRRARLAAELEQHGFAAAIFVPGPSFRYFTGLNFHLMERPTFLIVTRDADVLALIPELERSMWLANGPASETSFWQDADGYSNALQRLASHLPVGRIACEEQRIRLFEAQALEIAMPGSTLVDAQHVLTVPRLRKGPDEVDHLRQAVRIAEISFQETLTTIRTGQTEQDIRSVLLQRFFANGAQGIAFDPIVLAGGNAANPHGSPGASPVKPGSAILFDFGICVNGYNSDITRTVFCEHVEDQDAALYAAVLAANEKGRDVAAPGLSCAELDSAVTGELRSSPFAEFIVHKTGHGLGLDVHEAPQIMKGNPTRLEPGHVITIEPGLYRPGHLGVRIEDDVLITASGCESLTMLPRDLQIVGA